VTCNKEHLVSYIYDELGGAERAAFEAHLPGCADCRRELSQLRDTRQHLTTWAPPEPELSFHVVRGGAVPLAPPIPRRPFAALVPQWAFVPLSAAAALLLVAGAAAIANLEVRYGAGGLVVRTGWASSAAPAQPPQAAVTAASATAPAAARPAASEELIRQVEALTRRLRELEQAQSSVLARAAAPSRAVITVPELRRILAESESRQRTETALQVSQVWKDFNAARVSDFTRLQDAVSRAQGMTNQQLRQHRDSIESLYRTASQR
jgi:hypothetical protein